MYVYVNHRNFERILRLWVTTTTSVSGTVPKNLNKNTLIDGSPITSRTLTRPSAFRVGLGVSGTTIVSGSCTHPSYSWISHFLTSSLSIGISSLFCRVTQCM
jgi:hypothetical protein